MRAEHSFPPFTRLAAIRIDAGDADEAKRSAGILAAVARQHPLVRNESVHVLGPAPAPIERLRGRYRFRFLLRARERPALRAVVAAVARRIDEGVAPARASLDIDPYSML